MTDSQSLRELGLRAPDGLDCPLGGTHRVLEPELQVALSEALDKGSTTVRCQRCGAEVELVPTTDF